MRPALLIRNPLSGGRDWAPRLDRILANLAAAGFHSTVRATEAAGHATELARASAEGRDYDVVFGLGGDGTLREIAVGLLGSPIPLGLLPGGTTNVLALSLGIPTNAVAASRVYNARDLRVIDHDIGMCGDKPFIMMVSAGIDALLLERASQQAKKRWGKLAVGAQALAAARDYSFPTFSLSSQGHHQEGSFAMVANIPLYGGEFTVTPRARPDDGVLDLAVLTATGIVPTLTFALDLAIGAHDKRQDVEIWRSRLARLDLTGEPSEALIQIDGDPVRLPLPQDISLSPDRVKLLLPTPR
ncbi:MAG: diacylglycerol kinase family protein [Acidobacteriota bacterium]|nr:diacylglycerol kinase family protein [Acidobacteriota bacterium]